MTRQWVGDRLRGMSYAPVLALVFLLWPIMGLLGGQGYAIVVAGAGLLALIFARPKQPPAIYALLAFAFIAWAAVTELWSPASLGLISGNLLEGNFAIRATSVRIGLTAALGALAVAGTLQVASGSAQRPARLMLGAFAAQGLLVAASAFFAGPVLEMVYGPDPMEQAKGLQNIGRNANTFVLVLPILLAYLGARPGLAWKGIGAALVLVSAGVFMRVDSQAALGGLILMLGAFGLVWLAPKTGYRWLLSLFAGYIAAAPVLMGWTISGLRDAGIILPGSFESRVRSWEVVIGKTIEHPFVGNGLAASKTWRETYAEHPRWLAQLPDYWASYPVIPGHPHNMALQIWAETGLIGAVLVALALVVLAFRLPKPETLRADVRYAIAGLVGVTASLFSVAYNVWNEAFWGSVILAACGIILLSRRTRASL